jgi:hypothetical protein
MKQTSVLEAWLTPRRLLWLAIIGLLTLGAHAFESANVLTPLRTFTDDIGQSLDKFDSLTLGNRFYGALTGCRFTGRSEGFYACDGHPFYQRYVVGSTGPLGNDCLSYVPGICKPTPQPQSLPGSGVNFLRLPPSFQLGRGMGTCTTPTGQLGTQTFVCSGKKVHVPHIALYPVFVPGHLLFSTLSGIWGESSTLGAVLFLALTLIAAIIVAYWLAWDDSWYWQLALLLLLTPALASVIALALKLLLLVLIGVFSGVLGGIAWLIITFGGLFKIGFALFEVLDKAKTADELTKGAPGSSVDGKPPSP